MITLEPKWAKERLEEKITEIENKIETQALDHKAEGSLIAARSQLLKENEMWLQTRKESNPSMVEYIATRKEMSSLFKKADRKHAAMVELSEKGRPTYAKRITLEQEHKEIRKQLDRAMELETQSEASVKYWEEVVKNGFKKGAGHDLLQNSRMVEEGGIASFATKAKKRKPPKKSAKGGEEE
jgi:uncharacterized coiled-coil DUF342 family protein